MVGLSDPKELFEHLSRAEEASCVTLELTPSGLQKSSVG
ncbi:hypothetical protein CSC34_4555 [Pseudomonas aeruginosa]|nr:hypothetical protein CSC34_5143 [Pseudomonas aeruginosa]RAL79653.1 hypothetical protein CSC34_4555 [Pseudomonas aeruginosa]